MNESFLNICAYAAKLGFAKCRFVKKWDTRIWQNDIRESRNPHAQGLNPDAESLLPGMTGALVMFYPYAPYEKRTGEAEISAYYPASNQSYKNALLVAQEMERAGYRALAHAEIPCKPLILATGEAHYGRNGLTAVQEYGSRYAVQAILTDASYEDEPAQAVPEGERDLDDMCLHCNACVRACPTGALHNGRYVDHTRCLRALSDIYPMPEPFRKYAAGSVLGCDICQDVCPRNASVKRIPMPDELENALTFRNILQGSIKPLIPWIGANYARRAKLQSKALMSVANMGIAGEYDKEIQALTEDSVEYVRESARHAQKDIQTKN